MIFEWAFILGRQQVDKTKLTMAQFLSNVPISQEWSFINGTVHTRVYDSDYKGESLLNKNGKADKPSNSRDEHKFNQD